MPIPNAYTDLLISLKTRDHYHSERSLYDHFLGTYTLLKDWNNPETVCIAGLFHSIYGVQSRHAKNSRFQTRDKIKQVIGKNAEKLVYLFCSLPRGYYFSTTPSGITAQEKKALVEIEVANLWEQTPFVPTFHQQTCEQIITLFPSVENLMTPKAKIASRLLLKNIGV